MKKAFFLLILAATLLGSAAVYAQTGDVPGPGGGTGNVPGAPAPLEYNLLSPIPGGPKTITNGFSEYITYLFPFLLSFAALAALVMFVIGAVQYMLAGGNPGRATAARSRITDALVGLLIAVGAVVILETINPSLAEFTLDLKPAGYCQECTEQFQFDKSSNTTPSAGQAVWGSACNESGSGGCQAGFSCVRGHLNGNTIGGTFCASPGHLIGDSCKIDEDCIVGKCGGFISQTCS